MTELLPKPDKREAPFHRMNGPLSLSRQGGWWLASGAIILVIAGLAAVLASHFYDRLNGLREDVARGPVVAAALRTDLPPEVLELASRLGARAESAAVEMRQEGQMWSSAGARPMPFEARQTASTQSVEYIWTADLGPGGSVRAADYYVAGVGGLEVKALGLLPLAGEVGTPEIAHGEILRYLAELPWNPDAILLNRDLVWTAIDRTTLRVEYAGAAITFVLGHDGLPESMSAPGRVYMAGKRKRLVPWHGRFGRYRKMGGRLLPTEGEVAWVLDGKEFVYWRARLTTWSALPEPVA